MAGLFDSRDLANPLVSQPAGGSHQQVIPPPGRDGIQSGSTPTLAGGMGFEPRATGGALGGIDQTGVCADSVRMPKSTATEGGDEVQTVVPIPGNVAPGGSPGLEASTGMLGTASGDAEPGGRVVAGASAEGFVTPRSQQGLPTIS